MIDEAPETTTPEELEVIDPKMLRPLRKKDFKEVVHLKKGIAKFLRNHRDLISDEDSEAIAEKHEVLDEALKVENATRADLEKVANELTKKCEASVPNYRYSALRENVEVFFVAIVLAMAIRAYFFQPSRIPTGSMQPTLNGIIAYPDPETAVPGAEFTAPENYGRPGIAKRVFDKIWYGRTHVEMISDQEDFASFFGQNFSERPEFKLFPRTTLKTKGGQKFSVPGTKSRVELLLNYQIFKGGKAAKLESGDVIARGYIDTGDWVIVDRFTFHWRLPARDDIFVFTTRGISGTSRGPDGGPQHYIKRLVGVGGDKLTIEPPTLLINGEPAEEFGISRVASAENRYPGYQLQGSSDNYSRVPPGHYVAFGDNSKNSGDSRMWGLVPKENVVGRALGVYFPFGHHFGRVK